MVTVAAVFLLVSTIKCIVLDKSGFITTGYAISTFIYTVSAVIINYLLITYANNNGTVINEYGAAWHMLLIIMIVNTLHLGVILIAKNTSRLFN